MAFHPCPKCGQPVCSDCGEHQPGHVGNVWDDAKKAAEQALTGGASAINEFWANAGAPPSGGGGPDTVQVPTTTFAFDVFAALYAKQFVALIDQLQARYNLKRAYAGLKKIDFDQYPNAQWLDWDIALTGTKAPGVKFSTSAGLLARNRVIATTDCFGVTLNAPNNNTVVARSDALGWPNSSVQDIVNYYEYAASLVFTPAGGANPFSLALLPTIPRSTTNFVIGLIKGLMQRRINSLNETEVQLLGVIDAQIKRDKSSPSQLVSAPTFRQAVPVVAVKPMLRAAQEQMMARAAGASSARRSGSVSGSEEGQVGCNCGGWREEILREQEQRSQ